ncbi:MAG: DUF2065 domain-containing protein [Hyphomicrobiales bacterium]|jgi:uncharacterized protein
MRDFLAALGLVFAIEGLLFAAFPRGVARAMREVSEHGERHLRTAGIIAAVCGVALVWFARRAVGW